MAMTYQAPMTQNLKIATNSWYNSDGIIQKTLNTAGVPYTAGPNGAIVKGLFVTSNSTTVSIFQLALLEPAGASISSTGATGVALTTSITALAFASGDATQLSVGMGVSGTGIASGTYISAIVSATAITLSKATTATAGAVLVFSVAPVVTQTGVTNSTTAISGLSDTSQLAIGMGVTGSGVATGAYISTISSGTALVLSKATTTSIPGGTSLTFSPFPIVGSVSVIASSGANGVAVPVDILNPTLCPHLPIDQMGKTILYVPPYYKIVLANATAPAASAGCYAVTAMIEEF